MYIIYYMYNVLYCTVYIQTLYFVITLMRGLTYEFLTLIMHLGNAFLYLLREIKASLGVVCVDACFEGIRNGGDVQLLYKRAWRYQSKYYSTSVDFETMTQNSEGTFGAYYGGARVFGLLTD